MSETASYVIEHSCEEVVDKITKQMQSRSFRATTELRNAELRVLRGKRSGRVYRMPNTKRAHYRASAPGEPPAVRTGHYRLRWMRKSYATPSGSGKSMTIHSEIQSNVKVKGRLLGEMLEDGTAKMAPRPHKEEIIRRAKPKIIKIYKERYL